MQMWQPECSEKETKPTHSALEKSDQGFVTFTLARTKHIAL